VKKQNLKVLIIFLTALIFLISCEEDSVSPNKENPSNSIEKEVHQLINAHRTGMGLDPLEWNETIATECRTHSREMANAHTINHDGFNERINKIGETISWSWAGENVAYNYSAEAVVIAWLNSPGHKSNIESNSNLTGVGVAFDEDSVMYFTQIFIKSRN